ncbi:hypothetical protein [Roseivirga echinicomitans]|nr:hypothetical protein [Roseivirga echinicomitans]
MINSQILDIVLGFSFLFFLFSTLVTLLVEYASSKMDLRAKNLKKGIIKLLDDPEGQGLSKFFFEHPLIRGLSENGNKGFSNLSGDKFSKVLMDVLRTGGDSQKVGRESNFDNYTITQSIDKVGKDKFKDPDGSETLGLIKTFSKEASEDIKEFQNKLESWFDEQGDQMKDWFSREIKKVTLITSVILVLLFNIDTVRIYEALSQNEQLRIQFANSAFEYFKINPKEGEEKEGVDTPQEKLTQFYSGSLEKPIDLLGLGWPQSWAYYKEDGLRMLWAPFGMALSVLAISFGAPFWYDVISRVNQLRNTTQQNQSKNMKAQPVG